MAKLIAVKARTGTPAPAYGRSYDADGPASIEYPRVPLHALLDDAAESYPGSTATIFFNAKKSYATLLKDAKRFSAGLRALGVKKGDRVAIDMPNCPQFLIAFFGALRCAVSLGYPAMKAARQGTKIRNVIVTNSKEEIPPILRTLFTLATEKK